MTTLLSAVTLEDYAHRIGYQDCAFFGVNHPNNVNYACREIWTLDQRQSVEMALLQAQDMIENVLGYFLTPKWAVDEQHTFRDVLPLNWCHLIEMGVVDDSMISSAAVIAYITDPVVVTVLNVTCPVADIHVMFHDTDTEIMPTLKTLIGGTLTLEIPWCRLVDPAYQDNPANGLTHADVLTWGAPSVDIRCITNDNTAYMTLHRREFCNCDDYAGTGCAYIKNNKLSFISVIPDTTLCGCWEFGTFSYRSGLQQLTQQHKDAVIRLAHSLMPDEPCGCKITQRLWERDRKAPEILTRERINCPFGLSDGAWNTWVWVNTMKVVRGGFWQ